MHNFILLTTLLFFSISLFGQENKFNSEAYIKAGPNVKYHGVEQKSSKKPYKYAQSEEKRIYDFSSCTGNNYEKCFKDIETPKIFNFSKAKDEKKANKTYYKDLKKFIYNNLDNKTLGFFNANLTEKDSTYLFHFTYYRNHKGEVIPNLIGSTVKRSNQEIHKKLAFLLCKTKIKKGKFNSSLKNRQRFVLMTFKLDSSSNKLKLIANKKRSKLKAGDIIGSPPIYEGCNTINNDNSINTFKIQKKCLEQKLSNFVSKNFNTNLQQQTSTILAKKYGIYNKKIKTIVHFKFNKEGYITNIKSLGLLPEIEDEITRIVKKIPKVKPGTLNKKAVGVKYSLPVTIKTIKKK